MMNEINNSEIITTYIDKKIVFYKEKFPNHCWAALSGDLEGIIIHIVNLLDIYHPETHERIMKLFNKK